MDIQDFQNRITDILNRPSLYKNSSISIKNEFKCNQYKQRSSTAIEIKFSFKKYARYFKYRVYDGYIQKIINDNTKNKIDFYFTDTKTCNPDQNDFINIFLDFIDFLSHEINRYQKILPTLINIKNKTQIETLLLETDLLKDMLTKYQLLQ